MSDMFEHAVTVATKPDVSSWDLPEDGFDGGGSSNQPAGGAGGSTGGSGDPLLSDGARGLAIESIRADKSFEGLLGRWFNHQQELYFVSVAFDMSGQDPVVLPPSANKVESVHKVDVGNAVEFGWGSGAPLFPARVIAGGILVYVTLMEKDSGKHIGEILEKIHEDLEAEGSVLERIKDIIKNPGAELTRQLLDAGAAALQPIATVLKETSDDYIGVFQGLFGARGDWGQHLKQEQNGATVTLRELDSNS